MNKETAKKYQERQKLYQDVYNGVIPKRVPITISLSENIIAGYNNLSLKDANYNYASLSEGAVKLCEKLNCDESPLMPVSLTMTRTPRYYKILGSRSFIASENGQIQHPEVSALEVEEFDELIEDPLKCLIEKVLPRQYEQFNLSNPVKLLSSVLIANQGLERDINDSVSYFEKIIDHYGYYAGGPEDSYGFAEAPFDFLADQLRGFKNISMDIRRHKTKLKEAADAITPLMTQWGIVKNPDPLGSTFTPLHMPTFMREKDFEHLWFPSYLKMTQQWAAHGVRTFAFCEDDWTRYTDYLMELPAGTELWFEFGDPQKIKDKLGKKFILTGFYPIGLIKTGTKQECIDKAKELLDILMPGGNYIFGFDKNPLLLKDINLDNLFAVIDYVAEHAVYLDFGKQLTESILNRENFKKDSCLLDPIQSEYMFDRKNFVKENPEVPLHAVDQYEKDYKNFIEMLLYMLV